VALVDLGLPNMPGDRVARRLKDMHPELAAILISGWELDDGDVRREPFDLSLQKPFRDVHHVRQAVNAALRLHDERHSGAQG